MNEKIYFDIYGGVRVIKVYIGEHEYHNYLEPNKEESTLGQIIEEYKTDISICDAFCIEFENALHGEIYEFNKEDNLFYLIEQIQGWA